MCSTCSPSLVEHRPDRADQAHVQALRHGPRFDHGVLQAQRVAREDGLEPLDVLQPRRALAGGFEQEVGHHQPHRHGTGVPAAGAQAAKHRLLRGLFVEVKGLRIELGGEGHDFFGGGRDGAEVARGADGHVFPVVLDGCFGHGVLGRRVGRMKA
jgi:hypothetical protein